MKKFLVIYVSFLIFGCSNGSDSSDDGEVKDPAAALLVFPEPNSECTEGSNKTTTRSTIKFEWNSSINTDNYNLVVKNLETNSENIYNTTQTYKEVSLSRGVAFSWYVESKSNTSDIIAKSELRKFYNAGDGERAYAPFPADIIAPLNNETLSETTIFLDWNTSDLDGDVLSYDVFLDTANPPASFKTGITESKLEGVQVEASTTYYWKVLTRDALGNASTSETYSFKIE
ncbi:hypothetical protein [Aestuariibaculum sediminum]|uniref:Fibronectin type-III domain-containing protein n=1 Tax=Aestuariibaculum sediminum TaxID=2770637 RepID=A0A8J6U8G3_9FLAO|nr:hypothetical protein [Aestuariibaculum sediminum]MBD0833175.1 hypothetical protein [Aestuariibaculum sediminum]